MRRSALPCVLILLVILFAACTNKPEVRAEEKSASAPPTGNISFEVPHSRDADDVGRFLAGLPGKEGSAFQELEDTEDWKAHAQAADHAWASFEEKRLPRLREFAQQELANLKDPEGQVFYPFGGPDALTVTTFFPRSSHYVLVGLEPPGTLIPLKRFQGENLAEKLRLMRSTLESILGRSFFITRQMDAQLRGQITDGVLPDILVELVRTGHTVLGSQPVVINEDGRIVAKEGPPAARVKNNGVAIEYQDDADQARHQLFFFSVNLANEGASAVNPGMRANEPFLKAILGPRMVKTFFKSTSYMVHQERFSLIRDEVLDHSSAVLQDDSGIPYRFYTQRNWKVQLYGEYEKPYGSFRFLVQKDLRAAYDGGDPKKLNFRIGYGYGRQPSNLQLATRPE